MFRRLKYSFLIAALLTVAGACTSIHEDIPPCDVMLEFVFDHNLEYTDLFERKVNSVDVYVFDNEEKLVWTKRESTDNLIGNKRLVLPANLAPGAYKVLTVGALCEKFIFSKHDGEECHQGTTLDDVRLSLVRESEKVSHEFPHLWFSKQIVDIVIPERMTRHEVWQIPLIRETNKFKFVLVEQSTGGRVNEIATQEESAYTFEVVTPEGAVYSRENEPLAMGETLTYLPYSLHAGTGNEISVANLNTCRLLKRENCYYQIVIKEVATSKVVWKRDFLEVLENLNIDANGNELMDFQEFLDRKGEWDIVFLTKNFGEDDMMMGMEIGVGGWVVWFTDMGVG